MKWFRKLRHKIFLSVLNEIIPTLDQRHGFVFAFEGRVKKCSVCNKPLLLPPVMVPIDIGPDPGDPTGISNVVTYGSYHRGCAILDLLLPVSKEFFSKCNITSKKDSKTDG